MSHRIAYRGGYKYQLAYKYTIILKKFKQDDRNDISTPFIILYPDGSLIIRAGYAWDGPSGPTIDSNNFMRGSLVHDALYQLMREHHLDVREYRKIADETLRDICLQDGMSHIRAWYVYKSVRLFAEGAATAKPKKTYYAPKRKESYE